MLVLQLEFDVKLVKVQSGQLNSSLLFGSIKFKFIVTFSSVY